METVLTSNHCQDIMLRLNNDRKTSAKYCDITLVVGDHKFPAHKSVLGLLSTFFDKMFHIDMKEKRRNKAEINGVSKEVLEVILDFIYTGNITLSMENVFAVIEAAHFMDLPYFKAICSEYLGSQVNASNWLSISAYAKRYDYKELLDKVNEAVALKFNAIIRSEHFVELDVEELKHLLGLQNRKVNSEEEVYKAVIGWIKRDVTGHEKYSGKLLSFINFQELTLDFLKQVVANEKLIENSLVCTRAVLNAITNHPGTDNNPVAVVPPDVSFVAVNDRSVLKYNRGDVSNHVLSQNHRGGSAVKYNGSVYVISGSDTKTIEVCNIACESRVTEYSSSCQCRYIAASIVIDSQLYITGGLHAETSVVVGSPGFNRSWDFKAQNGVNFNRHGHALVSMFNSIYVIGGNADNDRSLLRFDLQTKQVEVLPPMLNKRIGLAAVTFMGQIYVISGSSDYDERSSSVEKFNPLKKTWQSASNLNVARYYPGACVINDHIVVVGGGSEKIEVYDEENDKWNIVGECEALKDVFAIFSEVDFHVHNGVRQGFPTGGGGSACTTMGDAIIIS